MLEFFARDQPQRIRRKYSVEILNALVRWYWRASATVAAAAATSALAVKAAAAATATQRAIRHRKRPTSHMYAFVDSEE